MTEKRLNKEHIPYIKYGGTSENKREIIESIERKKQLLKELGRDITDEEMENMICNYFKIDDKEKNRLLLIN